MTLQLIRKELGEDGIFSDLLDESGNVIARCAEHAYDGKPKVYDGEFTCVRGMHQLHGMDHQFETFEITGVEGHTGTLFHGGNWPQIDSDGCILLGSSEADSPKGKMVTNSIETFAKFMELVKGLDSFTLRVISFQ